MRSEPKLPKKWVWCYFRNLVHTVYREIRHIGPVHDTAAKLHVVDPTLVRAASQCAAKRPLLKGTKLFERVADATTVAGVLKPYYDTTGLTLSDLVRLFEMKGWVKNYGGSRWANITRTTLELEAALRDGDIDRALALLCDRVRQLRHNTARLVPLPGEWHGYVREKWPQLCECRCKSGRDNYQEAM